MKIDNKKKYASNENYMKLNDIAVVMTENGYPMNHSTVRNHLLSGLNKLAKAYMHSQGFDKDLIEEKYKSLAKSPEFHEFIYEFLQDYYVNKK